ncbi:MAG: type I 3-dehydroquinate dehydratase [Thermoanaerobaculia bacterium]
MSGSKHQFWATVSGTDRDEIASQVDALVRWGVEAIEFRVDLIPRNLWDSVLHERIPSVPWWVAHFGTGLDAQAAREAILATVASEAQGAIFHSRCEHLRELIDVSRRAGKLFAAPYHSQQPLTLEGALEEFAHQESLLPEFRKIAVRAMNFDDAAALLEATHRASRDGGSPAVGAIFGPQRWARVALPHAGSAITFVVARRVQNEVGSDDQQLQISEVDTLAKVRGIVDLPAGGVARGSGFAAGSEAQAA